MLSIVFEGVTQTSNLSQGCVPVTVQFTAPAGPSTYYWDFQDGSSSNLQNPNNTFTTPGSYNVEFKETPGGPVVGTVAITVFAKPVPEVILNSSTQGCAPVMVDLSGNVTLPSGITVTNWTWTFGEGSSSAGQNTTFTYVTPGSYTLTLGIVTNSLSCNNTVTFTNLVGVSNPTANFSTSPNPAVTCTAPLAVTFANTSTSSIPLTFDWDFGNGNTSASPNPPVQNYNTNGNYTSTLTITDTNGCEKTVSKPVSVGNPVANIFAPDTVCIDLPFNVVTNTAGSVQWTFDATASVPSSNDQSISQTYSTAGNHTINLTITSNGGGCSHDTSKVVFIEDPVVSVSAVPQPQCDTNAIYNYSVISNANIVSYSWVFADGTVSNLANPIHAWQVFDTAYMKRDSSYLAYGTLTAFTAGGCEITIDFADTIYWIYARFMPDKYQGCAPLSITFSDSTTSGYPLTNYHYDYGDGTSANFTTDAPHSYLFTNPGEYPVVMTATNTLGCTDISDTIWIEVGEPVALDFVGFPLEICPKDSITFTNLTVDPSNIDGWHYSTDGERLSGCFGNPNGKFVFNDTVGTFDVTLTANYNGCYSSVTKADYITVKGSLAKFTYFYDCLDTMDIQLTNKSMGYTSTTWDFGNGATGNSVDTVYTYPTTGEYWVRLSTFNDTTGCPVSVDSAKIFIRKIKANFDVLPVYCGFTPYPFDASASVDVYENCYHGYKWIFSDPVIRPITTSNPNTDLIMETSGPWELTLVVTDENGCTDSLTKGFNVYNVQSIFDLPTNLTCVPDTLMFNDMSLSDSTMVSWQWTFDDGDTSYTQNTSHIFTKDTTEFTVTLLVTDINGCADTLAQTINIYKPTSVISSVPSPVGGCMGKQIQFGATDYTDQGSNLNWSWSFGDGTSANGQFVNHTYAAEITTQVKMVYTEISTGCKDSATYNIDIQSPPIASYITDVDNEPALCSPQIINFINQSSANSPITSTTWTFSTGQSSSSQNPAFVFNTGSYTGQLVVKTSYGCADTVIKNFKVIGPVGNFLMDTNYICQGDAIQFTLIDTSDVGGFAWDFGDGQDTLDESPISHNYYFVPPSGQTVAKLTVYGVGGVCPSTAEKTVFIREVRAGFDRNDELDTTLCLGESLTLTNTSLNGDDFQWSFGDGENSTNGASSFTHQYNATNTFNISLAIHNVQYGCRDTITKQIIVFARPDIQAIGDTVCMNEVAQLGVNGFQTYYNCVWSPYSPLSDSSVFNTTASVNQTTVFTIDVVDTNTTCHTIDSAIVLAIPDLVSVYYDTTIVMGDSIQLPIDNQNGYLNFVWNPATDLSCYDCSYPWYQGFEDKTFNVEVSDELGCSTINSVYIVRIFPETFIDLPTTFTPNGDGVNDIIYLQGWGVKELKYFQIFNRWGELVFETNDIKVGWDGYYKGVLQNNGTYVYKAMVETFRGETIDGAGHINLMR